MSNDSAAGAAHDGEEHGGAEHLVKMANDIGNFFRAEPAREDAIAGIANHIDKFWTKRMREKINAHIKRTGDAGLDELPREALRRLQVPVPTRSATH
jgi:formate dehydrogenase subunit delta